MFALGRLWTSWTDTWRSPSRARRLYAALAVAFGVLAVAAAIAGDAAVAAIAGVAAAVTAALAALAPRLGRWTNSTRDSQG